MLSIQNLCDLAIAVRASLVLWHLTKTSRVDYPHTVYTVLACTLQFNQLKLSHFILRYVRISFF